ncbi:MAG: YfhO family protein [Anaerolineae bacterium]
MTILLLASLWAAATATLYRLHRRGRWESDRYRDLLAVGALGGLTLGFFWRPLLAGDVWLPADGGDLVSFLYPVYRFVASELHAGRIPLWNPYLYGGAPFIGDVQAGTFYPVNLLVSLLLPPDFPYTRMEWLSAFHFFVAGVNMYVCLRWLPGTPAPGENGRPVRRLAALAGAVAFMFSDLFLTHFGNLNLIAVFAWFPLVFGLFYRGLVVNRVGWSLGSGVVLGLATLAGHVQMSVFTALGLGCVALYEVIRRAAPSSERVEVSACFWLRPLLHLALCGAVALGLSALVLWPAWELAQHSSRAAWSYSETVEYSLSPPQLIGLLVPQFFGRGPALHWGLWPRVEAGYLGILPLVLVAAAWLFRRDRLTGLLTVLSLVALCLALGIYSILHGWLTYLVPGLGQLRASARFVGLMDFGLAALAAVGLDALLAVPPWEQPVPLIRLHSGLRKAALGVWLVPLPLAYVALLLGQDKDPGIVLRLSVTLIGVALFALFLSASWGWLALLRARWVSPAWAGVLAVGLIFVDLASTGAYIDLGGEDPSARFEAHPALVVDFLQYDSDLFRIDTRTGIENWWQPDTALFHRLQDVGGVVNPLELADYNRFWGSLGGRSSRLYDLLNVKYVIAPQGAPMDTAKFEVAFVEANLVVYRNRGYLPRAFLVSQALTVTPGSVWDSMRHLDSDPTALLLVEGGPAIQGPGETPGTVEITRYTPTQIECVVQTSGEAYLFLSEVFYPGWQATVDGQPASIYRANGIFRAVLVPPGEHRVALRFSPRSWWGGLAVSLFTAALLLGIGIASVVQRRSVRKAGE